MSVIWIDRVNEALVILEQSITVPSYLQNTGAGLLAEEFKKRIPEWREQLREIGGYRYESKPEKEP